MHALRTLSTRARTLTAVVALALAVAACGGSGPAPAANAVSIVNFSFNPGTLTVKAGTNVTWTNNGGSTHTVTAIDSSFDSGNVSPGSTFQHTFATAGTFAYHCTIHSSMTATVVVTP